MTIYDPITVARFWSKVDVRRSDDCWVWRGTRRKNGGYGQFRLNVPRTMFAAHRMALQIVNDRILEPKEFALHHCDNPPCCNPKHLYVGGHAQNMKDMMERKRRRSAIQVGERNGNSHLSEDDVIKIIDLINAGMNNCEIGRIYKVNHSTISLIRTGKNWRYLTYKIRI